MSKILRPLIVLMLVLLSCQSETKVVVDLERSPQELEVFSPNFISTGLYERDIAISPDGDELIYTLGNHKQSFRSLVFVKKNADGHWDDKEILSFSGSYNDIEPFFSLDGGTLFFASNRPTNDTEDIGDYNIWSVTKEGKQWGKPVLLNANINTDADEFYPSVSRHGNLYFTTTKDSGVGREDIYVSLLENNEYQPATVLDSTINTKMFEFNAYISPDEDLLIFSSYGRQDDMGGGDLYYSKKDAQGNWTPSKNMGEKVNSKVLDYCPFIDYDNNNLYFTSSRDELPSNRIQSVPDFIEFSKSLENGMGNIYRISLNALELN